MTLTTREQLEFFHNWVRELRSNNYQQDIGYLKTDAGHCCLGVACEIWPSGKWTEGQELQKVPGSFRTKSFKFAIGKELLSGALTAEMLAEIGMDADQQSVLMQLNDAGTSFVDIAYTIEVFILKPLKTKLHDEMYGSVLIGL